MIIDHNRRADAGNSGFAFGDTFNPSTFGERSAGKNVTRTAAAQRIDLAFGDDPAQSVRRLKRQNTPPVVAFTDVQLHTLTGLVDEALQHRSCGRGKGKLLLSSTRQCRKREPQDVSTLAIAAHKPVILERRGESVRCGTWQRGCFLQFGEAEPVGLDCQGVQNQHGLVQHSHPRYAFH